MTRPTSSGPRPSGVRSGPTFVPGPYVWVADLWSSRGARSRWVPKSAERIRVGVFTRRDNAPPQTPGGKGPPYRREGARPEGPWTCTVIGGPVACRSVLRETGRPRSPTPNKEAGDFGLTQSLPHKTGRPQRRKRRRDCRRPVPDLGVVLSGSGERGGGVRRPRAPSLTHVSVET